jgi:hypothetical protein
MTARITVTLIALAWATMMFGLMRDEVAPAVQYAREIAQYSSNAQLDALYPESRVDQMGIHAGGVRVGQSVTWYERDGDDLTIDSETTFDISALPLLKDIAGIFGGAKMMMEFRVHIMDGNLNEFSTKIRPGRGQMAIITISGRPLGDELHLEIRQFGVTRKERVKFDQRQFLSSALAPSISFKELHVGKQWRIMSLSPITHAIESHPAEVIGKESLPVDGTTYACYIVVVGKEGGMQARTWVTEEGTVVRQEVMGFTFIRENPSEEAMKRLN